MGKSTISMAIFNSYVELPEGRILEGLESVIDQRCFLNLRFRRDLEFRNGGMALYTFIRCGL